VPGEGTIAEEIVALLREGPGVEVPSAETDLITSGLLDSLGLVELIDAAEQRFGVELPLEEMELEQLSSPAGLAELVRAQGGRP
jgi:acyl carrier protein